MGGEFPAKPARRGDRQQLAAFPHHFHKAQSVSSNLECRKASAFAKQQPTTQRQEERNVLSLVCWGCSLPSHPGCCVYSRFLTCPPPPPSLSILAKELLGSNVNAQENLAVSSRARVLLLNFPCHGLQPSGWDRQTFLPMASPGGGCGERCQPRLLPPPSAKYVTCLISNTPLSEPDFVYLHNSLSALSD